MAPNNFCALPALPTRALATKTIEAGFGTGLVVPPSPKTRNVGPPVDPLYSKMCLETNC